MADWRSPAEEAAATDLCDESRVPRERHKKRVVQHQSPLTALVVHHRQPHQALVLNTSRYHDVKSETSVSDDCDHVGKCNAVVMSSECNVDYDKQHKDNTDLENIYISNGKQVNVKCNKVTSRIITGEENLLISGDCERKLVVERCTTSKSDNQSEGLVVLVEYENKSDGDGCDSDLNCKIGNTEPNATVVDAAAAAVAVSAIPETMKEIKQHMQHIDNTGNGVVARLSSPYKGKIRTAEDILVGPCGKKRCADRYDSSESSDSGVAVSCGECSSSGTSDITEPGSPCSTSSDEGVAIGGASTTRPLSSLPKLAPTTSSMHNGTRPQWPWTPPLATTACSMYKTHKGEPEVGTLPKVGAADPASRGSKITQLGKQNYHEHQGKITAYFKTQIKPQQLKTKKTSTEMSVMVAKNSSEFRRPPTVQRNKGGLAKYLGVVTPNGRIDHDWEVRTMTVSPPLTKKLPPVSPRVNVTKLDKELTSKAIPGFPIPSEVLSSISTCKISSLRLPSDASPNASGGSPPSTPTPKHPSQTETVASIKLESTGKSVVNENNNLTISSANHINSKEHPLSWIVHELLDKRAEKKPKTPSRIKEDEEEDEDDSSRSSESKPSTRSSESSSPILSAPTTIRFPARVPPKNNSQSNDSGICRWDKCNANFECSGLLLEHLQVAHINTQTGGDNFVCHWHGCKVKGRSSCSRRWLERHVLSHGGNKPFRCIVDGCGSRFSAQPALERHVNSHFNQPETSAANSRRSCENGGKLVRRNGKKLRYRRQPWSARLFDYFDTGVMEGLQHRLQELAKSRTRGRLAETPGNSMTLTSQVLARRVEKDGKTKVLVRWYPQDIEPDEWLLESEVRSTKHIRVRKAVSTSIDEVSLVLYPAVHGGLPATIRMKQRRKPAKDS